MIKNQNGSAIVWILVAVALFAALTYAFNSTSRVSIGNLSSAQAESYANEIIAYGNDVRTAVKRLRLRQCTDDEISFENNVVAGYANGNSPASNKCHIFESEGGGLTWKNPPTSAINGSGQYAFTASNEFDSTGNTCGAATCSELVLFITDVSDAVCIEINNSFGIINPSSAPPTDTDFTTTPQFIGNYTYATTIGDEAGGLNLVNQKSGCFRDVTDGENVYYNILIDQ